MAWTRKSFLVTAPVVALALLAASCGGDSPQDEPADCDYFLDAGITPNASACGGALNPFQDVDCADYHLQCFTVHVELLAQNGPGGQVPVPPPTQFDRFRLTSYTVQYVNAQTGRSVQGVDVPRTIQFDIPFAPEELEADFQLDGWPVLVPVQQTEPPFTSPGFFPTSGAGVDLDAVLTFFGHPEGDPSQDCSASFRYRFNAFRGGCP